MSVFFGNIASGHEASHSYRELGTWIPEHFNNGHGSGCGHASRMGDSDGSSRDKLSSGEGCGRGFGDGFADGAGHTDYTGEDVEDYDRDFR